MALQHGIMGCTSFGSIGYNIIKMEILGDKNVDKAMIEGSKTTMILKKKQNKNYFAIPSIQLDVIMSGKI